MYFDYERDALVDVRFSYTFPEEITLEKGEYYVELEFLENFSNALFLMKTRPMTGRTRYRYASQSDWETMPFGAPIYVGYEVQIHPIYRECRPDKDGTLCIWMIDGISVSEDAIGRACALGADDIHAGHHICKAYRGR